MPNNFNPFFPDNRNRRDCPPCRCDRDRHDDRRDDRRDRWDDNWSWR